MTDTAQQTNTAAGQAGSSDTGQPGQGSAGAGEQAGAENLPGGAGQAVEQGAVAGKEGETGGGEGSGQAEGDETPEGAPEAYAAFNLPEGVDIDESGLDELHGLFKELDLSQEKAQKLVDYEGQRIAAAREALEASYAQREDGWAEAAKQDKEVGGVGQVFDEKVAAAKKALDQLATPEFKSLLEPFHPKHNPEGLGLGNHPEVIRHFYRLSTQINEDGMLMVGGQTGNRDRETVLYGE